MLFYLFLRCISGVNVVEGSYGAPHNKEAVWGESSGVKCSPQFMSSMVVSTSNSSSGKEGTGRFLGLVNQQMELGQRAPDSNGRHCLKNKRQTCT